MYFSIDISQPHEIVSVNTHHYAKPTEPFYLNRICQYHDLIYVLEGNWLITEQNTDYFLKKNDVLLLTAGYHHYTRQPCTPDTRTFCIHVSPSETDTLQGVNTMQLSPIIHVKNCTVIRHTFESIVSVFWSDTPYKDIRLTTLFNQLMLQLNDFQNNYRPEQFGLAQRIMDLITENPHLRYKCSDVATLFSTSSKTIENSIIRATGQTFSKYQNSKKLEIAISHMRTEPDIRLSELASLVGFYDEFHFSRIFKQFYGVSPSVYKSTVLALQSPNSSKTDL